jgi:hypothetical protein
MIHSKHHLLASWLLNRQLVAPCCRKLEPQYSQDYLDRYNGSQAVSTSALVFVLGLELCVSAVAASAVSVSADHDDAV